MYGNRVFLNLSRNKNDHYLDIVDVRRFMSQILLMM